NVRTVLYGRLAYPDLLLLLMILRPQRSTLFPYTTLFRSFGENVRGETTLGGCACGWAKTHEIWVAYHGTKDAKDRTAASAAAKRDRKSTRLNSSHVETSYAVFCLKKKTKSSSACATPECS